MNIARAAHKSVMNAIPISPGDDQGFDATELTNLVDRDPALFQQFAQHFISSFETALTMMDTAISMNDMAGLGAMGHRTKSTARNIGAMALGLECELLENLVEARNFGEAKRIAIHLRPLFAGVRSTLLRGINPPQDSL